MLKFIHLYKHYFLGISVMGILAFILQEVPYFVMPFIRLEQNPIMHMHNVWKWLEAAQGFIGTLSIVLLMLLVRDDVGSFSIIEMHEKVFFALTLFMLLFNYCGWIFYYSGYQYRWLIVLSQFAAVPLYYFFFGL